MDTRLTALIYPLSGSSPLRLSPYGRMQTTQRRGSLGESARRRRPRPQRPVAAASVDAYIEKTVNLVKLTGEVIKKGIEILVQGEQTVEKAIPVLTDAFQKAEPVGRSLTKSASEITSAAVTAATPVVKDALSAASGALSEQGLDVTEVQSKTGSAVRTASEVATPAVKSSITFLTTTDPTLLGYYALTALGIYFFGPALLSTFMGVTRGYAGDISAAGALDTALNNTNAFLLDIRTRSEKERTGVLDVPGQVSSQLIEVEFAMTENRKLRGQLANPEDVESRITALQIAALRRLSRTSQIFLLDANGSLSKRVAKELNRVGFGKCFVVTSGYSGWLRSKLQTKPSASVYRPEVLSPATVLGTVLGGTTQRKVPTTNRRALPPGK